MPLGKKLKLYLGVVLLPVRMREKMYLWIVSLPVGKW